MICTNCGKGELQELTGTALLVCPLCDSKLINPQVQPPDPWKNMTHQEKEQVMQFLEDAAKVKKQFIPESRWPTEEEIEEAAAAWEIENSILDIFPMGVIPTKSWKAAIQWLQTSAGTREADLEKCLGEAMSLKGGWREAITELEDFCSEPVRLKNMIAAADQLDEWAAKAKKLLNPDKEKPSIAGDLYSGA